VRNYPGRNSPSFEFRIILCYYPVIMAWPPQIEYPCASYHVIVGGNQRQAIFLDDADSREYVDRLRRSQMRFGFILCAYLLMTNYVHQEMETPRSPLSKIMQLINFTYTRYFNRKYGKTGHLFQGKYNAFLCENTKVFCQKRTILICPRW
jgi:REP-associated tyrosine transposase